METTIYFKLCDLVIEYWYEEDGIEFDLLSVDGETNAVKAFEREHYREIKIVLIESLKSFFVAVLAAKEDARADLDAAYASLY